jgi:hypothetical protein
MIPPAENPQEKLARSIHRTLQSLPARRAPAALEQRVLAEIARRAALPWWSKSFVHWPMGARIGFLVVCAGIVKLLLMGSVWAAGGFDGGEFRAAFAQPFAWFEASRALLHAFTGFLEIIHRNIPPLWLYGGLAVVATAYATLVGLGAAAYRALAAQR